MKKTKRYSQLESCPHCNPQSGKQNQKSISNQWNNSTKLQGFALQYKFINSQQLNWQEMSCQHSEAPQGKVPSPVWKTSWHNTTQHRKIHHHCKGLTLKDINFKAFSISINSLWNCKHDIATGMKFHKEKNKLYHKKSKINDVGWQKITCGASWAWNPRDPLRIGEKQQEKLKVKIGGWMRKQRNLAEQKVKEGRNKGLESTMPIRHNNKMCMFCSST